MFSPRYSRRPHFVIVNDVTISDITYALITVRDRAYLYIGDWDIALFKKSSPLVLVLVIVSFQNKSHLLYFGNDPYNELPIPSGHEY